MPPKLQFFLLAMMLRPKKTLKNALDGSGLAVLDAGGLKRARELESIGFLQISLAGAEKKLHGAAVLPFTNKLKVNPKAIWDFFYCESLSDVDEKILAIIPICGKIIKYVL